MRTFFLFGVLLIVGSALCAGGAVAGSGVVAGEGVRSGKGESVNAGDAAKPPATVTPKTAGGTVSKTAGGAVSKTAGGAFPDLRDGAVFSGELFPGITEQKPVEIFLRGLAKTYPQRLLNAPPAVVKTPKIAGENALVKMPSGVEYLRCHANGAKQLVLPKFTSENRLVDLRYFATGADGVAACAALCEMVAGAAPVTRFRGKYAGEISVDGDAPAVAPTPVRPPSESPRVVVLVNAGTAGPIEAMLADLQARGRVLLVGQTTAGRTGSYAPLAGHAGWWRLAGEIVPVTGSRSLVGAGVKPFSEVNVSADAALVAWQRVEGGVSPEQLLALPRANATRAAADAEAARADLTLRRGYDLLVALQVMNVRPPFPKK